MELEESTAVPYWVIEQGTHLQVHHRQGRAIFLSACARRGGWLDGCSCIRSGVGQGLVLVSLWLHVM
jgi:hypothetical protein